MPEPFHSSRFRVYYEDTDAGGVVYYANYLKFAERARTEALRACHIDQSALYRDTGILFVVGECHIRYHAPARLDDLLDIETQLLEMRKVRMTMRQRVQRAGNKIAELTVTIVAVGPDGRATKIPDTVATPLLHHLPPIHGAAE